MGMGRKRSGKRCPPGFGTFGFRTLFLKVWEDTMQGRVVQSPGLIFALSLELSNVLLGD